MTKKSLISLFMALAMLVTLAVPAFASAATKYNITADYETSQGRVMFNYTSAEAGEEIVVSVIANDGYAIDEVTATDGTNPVTVTPDASETGFYSFIMPAADVTVSATFEVDPYDYEISLSYFSDQGDVQLSQEGGDEGDEIRVYITPASGFYLDEIEILDDYDNPVDFEEKLDYFVFEMPDSDVLVDVSFDDTNGDYDIDLNYSQSKGNVTLSRTAADKGDTVKIQVIPARGYSVSSVQVYRTGNSSKTYAVTRSGGYEIFTMPAYDVTVKVDFVKNGGDYIAELNYDETYGSAYLSRYTADEGQTVKIFYDGIRGYTVTDIYVDAKDGSDVTVNEADDGTCYWFLMPDADVEIELEFGIYVGDYDVNLECDINGDAWLSHESADEDDIVKIYADPDKNYAIDSIVVRKGTSTTGTKVSVIEEDDYSYFVMPDSDVTVYVEFIPSFATGDYDIDLVYGEQYGSVELSQNSADSGERVEIEIDPKTGYKIFAVYVEKTRTGASVSVKKSGSDYYFTMPAADVTVTVSFIKGTADNDDTDYTYDIILDYDYLLGEVELDYYGGDSGDRIKIYTYPEPGCEVDDIFAFDNEGNDITIRHSSSYDYFTMPAGDVYLFVEFIEDDGDDDYDYSGDYDIYTSYDKNCGSISVRPTTADMGDTVKVYVHPDDGYEFDEIEVRKKSNNSLVDVDEEDGYFAFEMPKGDVTVSVEFYESDGEYFVDTDFDDDLGEVTVYPRNANKGNTVKIYVDPDRNIEIDTVKVYRDSNNNSVQVKSTADYYYFTMPSDDVTVYVEFDDTYYDNDDDDDEDDRYDDEEYYVDLFFDDSYGDAWLNVDVAEKGDTIKINVDPDGDNSVKNVNVINSSDGSIITAKKSGTYYYFTMPAAHVFVDVVFKAEAVGAYDVDTDIDEDEGSIKLSGTMAGRNTEIRFYVTPEDGYEIEDVTVVRKDTKKSVSVEDYTDYVFSFKMPGADVEINVTFKKTVVNYSIIPSVDSTMGSATVTANIAVPGTVVKVTPTAKSGFMLDSVVVTERTNGNAVAVTAANGVYSFTMPEANVIVKVNFKKQPVPYYIVTDYDKTMAKVELSAGLATAGTTVTVTVTPSEEYVIDTVKGAYASSGNPFILIPAGEGKYTFVMPEESVKITVTMKKGVHVCKVDHFADVDVNEWYHEALDYVVKNGIMNGMGKDASTGKEYFAPKGTTTRAMVVTVLWRIAGSPKSTAVLPYTDVAEGQWYTEAIRWAAANGLLVNVSANDKFDPNATITREQFASVIYLFEVYKAGGNLEKPAYQLNFSDLNELSDWAKDSMNWCNVNKIINGNANGTLNPKGSTTRAELAQILLNYKDFN